jgi:hypothetical protein
MGLIYVLVVSEILYFLWSSSQKVTIMQIFLDGSRAYTLVVRQQTDIHEVMLIPAIYGLKPMWDPIR